MRKSYLLLIFVVLFAGMFGKLYADYPKFPLMERFTNASCPPCKTYNDRGYSAWVAANHNKLAIISWQTKFPGRDPMYSLTPAMPDTRVLFYDSVDVHGISGVPSVAFNGVTVGVVDNGSFYAQPPNAQLTGLLSAELAKRVPMSVTPTMEIVDDTARVHVDVVSDEAMDNIQLQVVIVESKVAYVTAPGTNGEKEFPYVARYALPTMKGTSFTIGATETKSFDFDQVLDEKLNTSCLYVVAFVEPSNSSKSNTHSIVQAGMSVATIPMPIPVAAEIKCTVTQPYTQAKKDSIITHSIYVTNTNDFDIQLEDIKVTNTLGDNANWEFVSTTIPDIMPIIKPDEELAMEYKLKYVGDSPSSAIVYVSFEPKITQEELALLDGNYIGISEPTNITFVNVSDNTKYAYITGLSDGDKNTYGAFSSTTYFNEELVEIPNLGMGECYYLFTSTKIIDSLEFLGLYSGDVFLINDALNGSNVMNKIKAMPNLKLFLNLSGLTYYYMAANMEDYDVECTAANNFITDMFGVRTANITDYYMQTYSDRTGLATSVSLKGVESDPIAAAAPSLIINGDQATFWIGYMCLFDIASTANATSVYTTNYSLLDRTIMAKYQNSDTRRVITGFDFSTMHNLPATARPIEIVANAIVDWLFDVNVIEDAEENLNPTNGLLLQTQPNPVTSVSDVIVQNTNSMPVQAKVYLLDATGNKVMDLFEGMLGVGNNSMSLSNRNIATGTYFIISETATGKTYMSVAISK